MGRLRASLGPAARRLHFLRDCAPPTTNEGSRVSPRRLRRRPYRNASCLDPARATGSPSPAAQAILACKPTRPRVPSSPSEILPLSSRHPRAEGVHYLCARIARAGRSLTCRAGARAGMVYHAHAIPATILYVFGMPGATNRLQAARMPRPLRILEGKGTPGKRGRTSARGAKEIR